MVLALPFTSVGCDLVVTKLATKLETESRPSYVEVRSENSLPILPRENGRLFVFKGGKMSFFGTDLCLNEKRYSLEDGTWFFVDLKTGGYLLTTKDGSENELNIEIKPGEETLVGVGEVPYLKIINFKYAMENFDSYNYALPDVMSYDIHPFVSKYYIRVCK